MKPSAILLYASMLVSIRVMAQQPVDYVNPLMGTQSKFQLSNGNTYPAIGRPWGMNLWTPQTGKMGDAWCYQYTTDKITGFKQTHQPSPWMNDYGYFALMPITGKMRFTEEDRSSWFSHKTEIARPNYYKVYLADADATVEITPTEHAGAVIGFRGLKRGALVNAKVASSFISFEQAERNLETEIGTKDFETVRQEGRKAWNDILGRVEVLGGTYEQMRTFYSCLYRMVFFPLKMYEKDTAGNIVHYSPYTGKVESGYKFAGTGFWDTFRALYPFLNLVYPSVVKEMQEGLISDFVEGGWLPEWSSPGYRAVMVGNNSASVVAEAYIKGSRDYDIEILWKALAHGANNEGPDATGRRGVSYYNQLGYVPNGVKINENVARSLEYAYDDFAIYSLGKALGKPASEIKVYKERTMNYKKLFDPAHLLMRPRNENGAFSSPYNPLSWGGAFTEGNSWHYSWSVFQDINGLKTLMGGDSMFVKMLDSVFIMPPDFGDYSYYGTIIHEMREMQIAGMGQYAHGNQPIQHMTYLYNYAGETWKTQYWVREVMNRLYNPGPEGYCGDEDNGQTSAWYVFSSLGFYPVTPAYPQYVIGAPLFKKAIITFENGKKLTINTPANNAANRYIQSITINGTSSTKNYLNHFDLLKGGNINFSMGPQPNKSRGIQPSDYPFSMSTDK